MESNLIPQVIRTYYSGNNGNLMEEYFQSNGKKEGEYKRYHQNGQLWEICNYVNDKRDGDYKTYHQTGNLDKHIIYSYGQIIKIIK